MTDKERRLYVERVFLKCIKPINNIRRGKCGCQIGQTYWFEYVHDTGDNCEHPNADAFYRKLSDNYHYDEVFITDEELINNFIRIK